MGKFLIALCSIFCFAFCLPCTNDCPAVNHLHMCQNNYVFWCVEGKYCSKKCSAANPEVIFPTKISQNALNVYNILRLTFNLAGTAGIMGNINVETGGTFDYQQWQKGGGLGYGLFQMQGSKYKAYYQYLSKQSAIDSMLSQINFMISTLLGDYKYVIGAGIAKRILGALRSGDYETATRVFCFQWERPRYPQNTIQERKKFARQYYISFVKMKQK